MADRCKGWSDRKIDKPIMLDRDSGFVGKEPGEEFDRRCTGSLQGDPRPVPEPHLSSGQEKGLPLPGTLFGSRCDLCTHPNKGSWPADETRAPGCPLSYLYALASAYSRLLIAFMKRLRSSRPRLLSREPRIWPAAFSGSTASTRVEPSSS